MPIISKRNFKTVLGDTNLELEAKTGQGLIIKNILIYDPLTNYITVSISKTTVGYFRVGGPLGSHLAFHLGKPYPTAFETIGGHVNQTTLLDYLFNLGLFTGYPVASGEKFLITGAKQSSAVQCVEYEIWDAADITPEMDNGSKSSIYLYINYGRTASTINVTTDVILTVANNPAEFPDFPYDNIVPAGRNIELHGILASDVMPGTFNPNIKTYTQFLKFMQDKLFLFDVDRQGLPYLSLGGIPHMTDPTVAEGNSLGGNYSDVDLKYPFRFDPPLIFSQGEELTISWKCAKVGAGVAISLAEQEIALILKMTPIS